MSTPTPDELLVKSAEALVEFETALRESEVSLSKTAAEKAAFQARGADVAPLLKQAGIIQTDAEVTKLSDPNFVLDLLKAAAVDRVNLFSQISTLRAEKVASNAIDSGSPGHPAGKTASAVKVAGSMNKQAAAEEARRAIEDACSSIM